MVTNPRVPRVVRHSLNLESGLNDGLALPAVLAFFAGWRGDEDFVWWQFVLQDVTLGFAFGIGMGLLAAALMPRSARRSPRTSSRCTRSASRSRPTASTVALPPEGNGLIAVFVCAITLGIRRHDLRETFEERADDIVEIVKLGVFVVFGSLLTLDGLFGDGWAAVAIVAITLLIARPVAIAVALLGTQAAVYLQAFMAWFGPKGVATMTFSLLVLAEGFPGDERIFNLAALCVFASILAHGLTDTPGVAELDAAAKRVQRSAPAPGR